MARDLVGDAVDEMIAKVSGDDVGDDDVGDDVGYEVGKARRKKAVLRALGSSVGTRSDRTVFKRAPLGLGTYSLATGISVTLTGTVQRGFQPDRLLVTSSLLGIIITSIKVGDEEQVLNGSVPAELYGINALNDSLADDFSAGAAAITFSVSLTNTNAAVVTGAVGFKGACKR